MFLRVPPDEVSLFASAGQGFPSRSRNPGASCPGGMEGSKAAKWKATGNEHLQGKEKMSASMAPSSPSQHSACPDGPGFSE